MNLASTKERVLTIPAIKRVGGVAQLQQALEQQQFTQDAWLAILAVKPGENGLATQVSQIVNVRIALIRTLRYAGDQTGDQLLNLVDDVQQQHFGALLGWSPLDGYAPYVYAGGQVIAFSPGVMLWSDEFETSFVLRSVN